MGKRIYLSAPDTGDLERELVAEAFDTNWIAPVGPQVDAFEAEFCTVVRSRAACAVSSGTAGLHVALRLAGVGPGDEVLCSTFSFVASANPIVYLGGRPVFLDSEERSWNLDPAVLEAVLKAKAAAGVRPKALVLVHIYGQGADAGPIVNLCARYGVTLIEDAAEALGATVEGRHVGTFGRIGVFSFNGNKIITTSGGGMIVSDDEDVVERARFLVTQARDLGTYYRHSEMGYNYRLSNVCAAIGRGQLRRLAVKVDQRRAIFEEYRRRLGDLPGVAFMPEASFGRATRWLTCLTIDPAQAPLDRDALVRRMEERNIETRPVWRPLHRQPLFAGSEYHGGDVAERIGALGVSLPSSSNLTAEELDLVASAVRSAFGAAD